MAILLMLFNYGFSLIRIVFSILGIVCMVKYLTNRPK